MHPTRSKLHDRKKWAKSRTTRRLSAALRPVNIGELRTTQRLSACSRLPATDTTITTTTTFDYTQQVMIISLLSLFVRVIQARKHHECAFVRFLFIIFFLSGCLFGPVRFCFLFCFYYFLLARVDYLVGFSVGFGNQNLFSLLNPIVGTTQPKRPFSLFREMLMVAEPCRTLRFWTVTGMRQVLLGPGTCCVACNGICTVAEPKYCWTGTR